jgi:hypothetical protein
MSASVMRAAAAIVFSRLVVRFDIALFNRDSVVPKLPRRVLIDVTAPLTAAKAALAADAAKSLVVPDNEYVIAEDPVAANPSRCNVAPPPASKPICDVEAASKPIWKFIT